MPALKPQAPPEKMTVDEFVQWSENQEGKWELHDGIAVRLHDPLKMQSERIGHVRAKQKIFQALETAIKKSDLNCEALIDGATVRIEETIFYEPDALVHCNKTLDDDTLCVPDPIIIIEVLSPSTAYKDVSTKLIDYFKLPSVMHYLIIDPATKQIQHHFRPDGLFTNPVRSTILQEDKLTLNPPQITVDLSTILEI